MIDYSEIIEVTENSPFIVAFYATCYDIIQVRDHAEFCPCGDEIAVLETCKHGTEKSVLEFHCYSLLQMREIEKLAQRIDPFHDIEIINF